MADISNYLAKKIPNDFRVADTQQIGIGAFTALVRVAERVSMESAAPVTVLEDGSFVNDHVINQPIILQIDGEVSDIQANELISDTIIKRVNENLGIITKYAPIRTASQIQRVNGIVNEARDIINKIDDVLDDSKQIYELFGNKSQSVGNTKKFFDYIESLRMAKVPIRVQMPYKVYDNMVIISVSIANDNEFDPLGFSITAQEIRFAEVEFIGIEEFKKNPASGLEGQTNGSVNKGINEGTEINDSESVLSAGISFIGGLF